MAEGKFASVCSVEEFILEQENINAAHKIEKDVRLKTGNWKLFQWLS